MPCHRSTPAGNFKLDGLMHGRLDLVARCITASFFVSYGVRRNTRYTVTLSDKERKHKDRTVLVNGAMVKHLRPDERSIGSLLHKLLAPSADDVSASVCVLAPPSRCCICAINSNGILNSQTRGAVVPCRVASTPARTTRGTRYACSP
eukprot:m.871341 g.871341  ORF g.871341 m.871341 type:complete len:148 (+) comp23568_c0_seq32:129-572(+)